VILKTVSMDFKETGGLFEIKTANEWIEESKLKPMPKKLFSELWFEGELCILFADTNVGKSILAVQIADSISRGIPINGFQLECQAQKVVYFDLELSTKQFELRYCDQRGEMHHKFSDNLIRVEFNKDFIPEGNTTEGFVISEIKRVIEESGATIMVFDNITYINTDNEKAKDAGSLMKELKQIKTNYNISMLVLAHTPKRDKYRQLIINDLAGSKMISNFADSIIAIGQDNQRADRRYIKQLKQRNTELRYGEDNVIVCRIEKSLNYLQFVFEENSGELDLIKQPFEESENDLGLFEEVKKLKDQGFSYREIASHLEINHMRAKRIFDKHK
jgi:KaiC/GvpD/RAD55 family RecA-like ATPase